MANDPVDFGLLHFHEVMVRICDDFNMSHKQMMALRQRLQHVYDHQKIRPNRAGVSIKALSVLAYRRLADKETLDDILAAHSGDLLKHARKIDQDFA